MGRDLYLSVTPDLPAALRRLADAGEVLLPAMVDGQLCLPSAPLPPGWTDVRLRSAAGMIAVKRRPDGVSLAVFGNADGPLLATCERLAEALRATQANGVSGPGSS